MKSLGSLELAIVLQPAVRTRTIIDSVIVLLTTETANEGSCVSSLQAILDRTMGGKNKGVWVRRRKPEKGSE